MWDCHRSTNNRYSGDNRLIALESSYRQRGLAPRCRLILSWGCIRSQGSGCSPVKRVRELGLERRETVVIMTVAVLKSGYMLESLGISYYLGIKYSR